LGQQVERPPDRESEAAASLENDKTKITQFPKPSQNPLGHQEGFVARTQETLHSRKAERGLLACLILENYLLFSLEDLSSNDFYLESHKVLFNKINDLISNSGGCDFRILHEELTRSGELEGVGGIEYITGLIDDIPSTRYFHTYTHRVREFSKKRRVVAESWNAIRHAHNGFTSSELVQENIQSLQKLQKEFESNFAGDDYIEFAPDFLSAEDPVTEYLVPELLPRGVICLPHGEPRLLKTWFCLELAVACATATPAFGLERFRPKKPVNVFYSSQEDLAKSVRERVRLLLKGRGIDKWPDTLAFSVHRGINFDQPQWRQRLLADIEKHQFALAIFDPIRRYSENADKGPAEVRNITAYLREIIVHTGISIAAAHHDVKPPSQKQDERRRGHRASGGDWFASSDCPIAFEAAGKNKVLVIPEDYKFSLDPAPFTISLIETNEGIILQGKNEDARQVADLTLQGKIIDHLKEHTHISGNAIVTGIKANRERVYETLDRMKEAGKIDWIEGKRKSKCWFLTTMGENL
jgi:hypothetical protein